MKKSIKNIFKGQAKRMTAILLMLGVLLASIPLTAMSAFVSADSSEAALLSGADIATESRPVSKTDKAEKDTAVDNVSGSGTVSDLTESDIKAVSESDEISVSASDAPILMYSMYSISPLAADDIASGTSGSCSWVIDANGAMRIYPTNGTSGTLSSNTWSSYNKQITSLTIEEGVKAPNNAKALFSRLESCKTIDVSKLDTSSTTTMEEMFQYLGATEIVISGWNTSKVKNMKNMFCGSKCKKIVIKDVDTSGVTNMSVMFQNSSNLVDLDISGLDTGNVTDFMGMFHGCRSIEVLDLSTFDTSKATTFQIMFQDCENLKKLDVSSFVFPASVNKSWMFNESELMIEYEVGTGWGPNSSYTFFADMNYFNVKNGSLYYYSEGAYRARSVVIHDHDTGEDIVVDLEAYPTSYPGFTGNKTATVLFGIPYTVSFYDYKISPSLVSKQTVYKGEDATDPYADPSVRPVVEGMYFTGWNSNFTNITRNTSVSAKYSYINYTVKFDANGGSGTMADESFVYDTAKTLTANAFTREGYKFLGWNTDKNATTALYTDKQSVKNLTTVNEDVITLYAIWQDTSYTIKFNAIGGTGTMADQRFALTDKKALTKNAFSKEGYEFLGWDTDSSADSVVYTDAQVVEKLSNTSGTVVNLYAVWRVNQYTIDFDSNGGSEVADITQNYGTAVTKPADPTREGYTFAGWDTEIPAKMPAKDMKITAQWTINQYTIDFDSNGGSEVADITQNYGTAVTKPADPTREGYTFAGWDTEIPATMPAKNMKITASWIINQYTIDFDSNGGTEVADITQNYGTAVTKPADPTREGYTFADWDTEIPAKMPAKDMKITAKWTINEYTIDFDSNGGTEVADITQAYNTDVTKPADPTREGYTFAGWDTEIPATMPAKNMKITASWTINEYTIDFDSNGGTEVADITQNYGTAVTKPADPTREGYTFAGWDTEIPATMPAEDMKITALWTANSYLIAFDANSGEGTMEDQEMLFDTPANLSANTFTKKNYEFVGWSTDSAATTPEYTDCQEVVNLSTGDKVTLYAVWSKNAVTVTATAGVGGSVTPEEANVLIGGRIDITITTANDRYEIEKVTVNGTEVDLSTLTESGDSKILSLASVVEETDVSVSFSAEPIVGAPSVIFADEDRVFKVNEKIEFEAIGFWQSNANRIAGDEYYVPEKWHHAEPSGDWGGIDDSAYDYSTSFKQSKAGTYILKVDFRKYVYDGTAWADSGIVTIETEYIVKGEVRGASDTPDTGDNGTGVIIALNLMLISAFGIVICIQWKRRKNKENA